MTRKYIVLIAGLGFATGASAAIQLQSVAGGLSRPLFVTAANDGTNRLFILEQDGFIRVLQPGSSTPTQFLDLDSLIDSTDNERGLLGLAFHPQYAINGRFFVYYTHESDGALRIAEYHVSANPNVADTTETPLLTIPHPGQANHNGGMMAFGPDGYLYLATGDGGSGNDPPNNAQNINSLLGKMLRIDVDTPNGAIPYSSPPSNPYFGPTAGLDEIYALGLRNPWRWSFDRGGSNQIYLGDVGQGQWEEIDIITLGGNFGWRVYEGAHCTNNDPGLCNPANYIMPIAEYDQGGSLCAITGGYVYRGYRNTFPTGAYVFADYCTGDISTLIPANSSGTQALQLNTSHQLTSFGQDEAGEHYMCARSGTVYRIVLVPTPTVCNYSTSPDSGSIGSSGGGGSFDVTAASDCGWTVASHASWITVTTSPKFGAGNATINYSVAKNNGPAHSGEIKVAGQTYTVNQAAGAAITTWRSVRTHGGGAGALAIPLNAVASGNGIGGPTVETRTGGIQRIEIDFDSAITLVDGNAVSVTGYTTSGGSPGPAVPYTPAGVLVVDSNTLAITFTAGPAAGSLPDASCFVIGVSPPLIAQGFAGDREIMIRSLIGDTTGSGDITLSDALYTASLLASPPAASAAPQHDVNLDGSISVGDALANKARVSSPRLRALCP